MMREVCLQEGEMVRESKGGNAEEGVDRLLGRRTTYWLNVDRVGSEDGSNCVTDLGKSAWGIKWTAKTVRITLKYPREAENNLGGRYTGEILLGLDPRRAESVVSESFW
jgi:hypothetical protein